MSTTTAVNKKQSQRAQQVRELGLVKYVRKEDYSNLNDEDWDKMIKSNLEEKKEAEQPKKKTSYDLMSDAGSIKLEIEKVLIDDPEDADEQLEKLFSALEATKGTAEDKLASYVWVKDKINEQISSAKGVKEYYHGEKKKFLDTEKSRKNDLGRLKDRVVQLLENVFDGKTKVNGKSISVVEKVSGTITDKALAYETLKDKGLAWVEYNVSGDKVKDLKTRVANILQLMQDKEGEPQPVDLVDLQTKLMDFQAEFTSEPEYQFASGSEINSFVNDRIKDRREVKMNLIARFGGVDPEDMDAEDREEFTTLLEADLEAYPLDGIEVTITKYLRGL